VKERNSTALVALDQTEKNPELSKCRRRNAALGMRVFRQVVIESRRIYDGLLADNCMSHLDPLTAVLGPKRPPSRASQVSRATQGLRAMLLRGEFRPGERIAEIPVASKLGVSRYPLRLALEKLEHEGLIKARPKGFVACGFSLDEIWDALETRGVLEGAAARLAAERHLHFTQLEPLLKINREVEAILDSDLNIFTDRYTELNQAFHAGIVTLSANQTLKRTIERINQLPFTSPGALVLLYKNLPASKELIPIAQEQHRAIVEAIGKGQGPRAESVAREHSLLTRRNFELALSDWQVMRAIPGARMVTLPKPEGE
jgi:GntR family transcriptional regulator, vanillate catabolism transcriptional regulator